MRRLILPAVVGASIALAGIWGCSAAARDQLKRFFFEVPQDKGTSGASEGVTRGEENRPALALPTPRFASVHPPYKRRQCSGCHNPTRQMQVSDTLADACRPCHGRFFGEEVRHSPVADGECATCHEMHRSTLPNLLKLSMPDLCVDCHDEPEDLSEDAHGAGNVANCTGCHDPHFGGDMLLRIEK